MARRIVHQLVDDLDGSVLDVGEGETVLFSLDGTAYEIDLTDENASAFREVLAPYVEAARRVSGARSSSSSTPRRRNPRQDYAAVREWAKANGYTVSDRGRVPATILEAYDAAH
ncbi:histone-like nucleoid-structuring protein Lsr2 [Microbacterium aquimaris]|uniref:Lsr2 family protein n=1 Tax=Microbacterium aquimaris TaxID=459816 RepID=A0ABU5NA07_9MICO|nr:Lsr2 family protein [Microbacterium aquimaris]MDZ8162916.1 Lsr2 family protein [Microbacterium aquimaris]